MLRLVGVSFSVGLLLAACGSPDGSASRSNADPNNRAGAGAASNSGGSKATGTGEATGSGGTPGSGGTTTGSGGSTNGSGGDGTAGTNTGKVADVFQHSDYGGWSVSLAVGDYTTADLVALGGIDNDASSVRVTPGYEVILFDGNELNGESITITADTPSVRIFNFNDLTSSIRVQVASGGTGGSGGSGGSGTGGSSTGSSGGSGGVGGVGPTSCQPAFETACKPQIIFTNQEANGGGALFNKLFPNPASVMQDITCTVCSILYRDPNEIPQENRHTTVNLTIDNHDGVAYASGNSITMSARHLRNYTDPDRASVEYRGIMVHETVHLYQHYGNGGTGEGMADCVRVRVGLYEPGGCSRGGSWRDAYTTSGCFYSWLTGPSVYLKNAYNSYDADLPYKINAALAGTSDEGSYTAVANLLQQTFGQNVDTLWNLYQNDL